MEVMELMVEVIDHDEHKNTVAGICIDLKKAFDSIDFNKLLVLGNFL